MNCIEFWEKYKDNEIIIDGNICKLFMLDDEDWVLLEVISNKYKPKYYSNRDEGGDMNSPFTWTGLHRFMDDVVLGENPITGNRYMWASEFDDIDVEVINKDFITF